MNPLSQYRSYRSLLRSQWLDPAAIRSLQDSRLGALVHRAYNHVPFYKALFDGAGLKPEQIRSVDDLQRIPITTKSTLQQLQVTERISDDYELVELSAERTSGSTGQPFTSYFDKHFVSIRNGLFLRALHVAGYRFGQRLLLVTSGQKQSRPLLRWRYASIETPPEDLVSELNRFRPSVVYGCATPLRLMAECIRASNVDCHHPQVVVSTAETLDRNTRELLRDAFEADVYDIYGLTEMGLVAWECSAHDGYHLSEDTTIVELVQDEDRDAGRLVMTNLGLDAMPLIRFQTGDLATPEAAENCRCGRTLGRIRCIEGRLVDRLRLPDNTVVTPYRLTLALENIPGLGRYQIVQTRPDLCIVRIETVDGGNSGLAETVRRALAPVVGTQVRIDVAFEPSIAPPPGRKFRIVENQSSS